MTAKLSPRMIEVLRFYAVRDMGMTLNEFGMVTRTGNTLAALIGRGLITADMMHELTKAGRDVILGVTGDEFGWWATEYRRWFWRQYAEQQAEGHDNV